MAGIHQNVPKYVGIFQTYNSGTRYRLPEWLGCIRISQNILGYLGLGILGLGTGSQKGWDASGYPRISWDILDLGFWDSVQAARMSGYIKISQDILGYPGLGILGAARMAGIHPRISWDILDLGFWELPECLGYIRISQDILGCIGLGILGLGVGCQNGWDASGYPRISKDILDLGLWDSI